MFYIDAPLSIYSAPPFKIFPAGMIGRHYFLYQLNVTRGFCNCYIVAFFKTSAFKRARIFMPVISTIILQGC